MCSKIELHLGGYPGWGCFAPPDFTVRWWGSALSYPPRWPVPHPRDYAVTRDDVPCRTATTTRILACYR